MKLADRNGAGHLVFNHDGTRMATATVDGGIRLWDTQAHQEVALLRGHTYAVSTIAFSPDGNRLVSGSIDRTVRFWETQPASVRLQARRAKQESVPQ
jgi:WD40 repeat protein